MPILRVLVVSSVVGILLVLTCFGFDIASIRSSLVLCTADTAGTGSNLAVRTLIFTATAHMYCDCALYQVLSILPIFGSTNGKNTGSAGSAAVVLVKQNPKYCEYGHFEFRLKAVKPCRTPVPFRGQTTHVLSALFPHCGAKMYPQQYQTSVYCCE